MCFESTLVHPGNGCSDRTEDVSYVLLMEFKRGEDAFEGVGDLISCYGGAS